MRFVRNSFSASFLLTVATVGMVSAEEPAENPPAKLHVINADNRVLSVVQFRSSSEGVSRGTLEPGREVTYEATVGDRFEFRTSDASEPVVVPCQVRIQGFRYDPTATHGIPTYYSQRVDADGFPIVASSSVSPFALEEARYLVKLLLKNRPDVRQAMIQSGARLCLLGYQEFTTDLPEFARLAEERLPDFPGLTAKDYWDARARGTGGSETDPFCSCGEENLLCFPGDPYSTENILIHEFAHSIHLRGMLNVDPTFDYRLRAAFQRSTAKGLWKGKYASVNHHEYFAEGVQSWFDNNRENDHDHNHVNTRSELLEYDPELAAFCREVFGDTEIQYTKPNTRIYGHLQGWDPAASPTFTWPERLQHAKAAILTHAKARSEAGSNDPPKPANPSKDPRENDYQTRKVEGWTTFVHRKLSEQHPQMTDKALTLLAQQLKEVSSVVPKAALTQLRAVPLYLSPEYPGIPPRAEYHPSEDWLVKNNRDPAMAKAVEFTNIRIFEEENDRMPNFVLHELAHAWHDRVLPQGYANEEIQAAFERAKSAGIYSVVERWHGSGRPRTREQAYAISNPMEYFAESTEAWFARNDYFPYTRRELKKHDPEMAKLLVRLWNAP